MDSYVASFHLLGLSDQNLPVFKEARVRRLRSIDRMNKLISVLPRLAPKVPQVFKLDPKDPEWDDKMIYPVVNYPQLFAKFMIWGSMTALYAYNWNVLHGNLRLRLFAYAYPFVSALALGSIVKDYNVQLQKVRLFENYCETRAHELFEQNRFMLDHEHFKRFVWFTEDMRETLARVHRQANNHDASDFKDSELILQDFIRRYSDPNNPDAAQFWEDGSPKLLN